ncbi:MAG: hypothetical protein WCH11_01185 [Bdellovibrio sp.]
MEEQAQPLLQTIVEVAHRLHMPVLATGLLVGVTLRILVFYTVRRHEWFGREFENRVTQFLNSEHDRKTSQVSFYILAKKLLEKSFYEVFEQREKLKAGRRDTLMLMSDRVFLIKLGCAWMVRDLLRQIRFLRYGAQAPKLVNITKNTFLKNPAFNRVFGIIPIGGSNDFLNILPGLFVIGGIFGTFLGVMEGLPKLQGMQMDNPELTKRIMDEFLVSVSLSMGASLLGIACSVFMTFVNTAFSPERRYSDMIDRLENALDLLWNYANSNEVPAGIGQFDETRDPEEALAEAALNQELLKRPFTRDDGLAGPERPGSNSKVA